MDLNDSGKQVVKRLDDNPDLVDVLISIEDYFDRNNLYVFKNWIDGELVDGPYVEPYWVKVTFKWPYKQMPDPSGGKRLLPHGTKILYHRDYENVPQPIKKPDDYEPGTHKPKIKKEKIWLVEMMIPRRFLDEINDKVMDLYGEKIEDVGQAAVNQDQNQNAGPELGPGEENEF
jgi:hypothetical protein